LRKYFFRVKNNVLKLKLFFCSDKYFDLDFKKGFVHAFGRKSSDFSHTPHTSLPLSPLSPLSLSLYLSLSHSISISSLYHISHFLLSFFYIHALFYLFHFNLLLLPFIICQSQGLSPSVSCLSQAEFIPLFALLLFVFRLSQKLDD
jgi:hypothetical protein